jgi:hypothetical protein
MITQQILMAIVIFSNSNLNFNTFSIFNDQPWQFGFQDGVAIFVGYSFGFYFKLFFIFFLIIVNLFLLISLNKEDKVNKREYLQAGLGGRDPKKLLYIVGGVLANISAIIAIKIEAIEQHIGNFNNQVQNLNSTIADRTENLKSINQELKAQQQEYIRIHGIEIQHTAHYLRLEDCKNRISSEIDRFNSKASSEAPLSELFCICESLKRNISKYGDEIKTFEKEVATSSADQLVNVDKSDRDSIDGLDIHKSSIINFDFSIEWFQSLLGIQQLAVGIILGKSVILSALVSIVLIFYGENLLNKYDIANKYPKIAKIIALRRKYQKYYFNYNCLLILIIIINE